MRTFIAVEIEDEIVNNVYKFIMKAQKEIVNNKVTWVKKENLHITLKFLGEINETQVDTINTLLEKISRRYNKFEVLISSVGVFPDIKFARVLWLGVKNDFVLQEIAKEIEKEMLSIGLSKEEKDFFAHLTIGRVKKLTDKSEIEKFIKNYQNLEFGRSKIDSITFFQSILKPEGPQYVVIKKFTLIS